MQLRRRSFWWVALLGLLIACKSAEPATEVLVVVRSDLKPGSELSKLHVEVFDPLGKNTLSTEDFTVVAKNGRANAYTLPLSYSLTPGSRGNSSSFRIVVSGIGRLAGDSGESKLVESQVIAAFQPSVRLQLDIFLARACVQKLCNETSSKLAGQTCIAGSCRAVPKRELASAGPGPFGTPVKPEADSDEDAGRRERPDAGEPTAAPDCKEDADCERVLSGAVPEGCAEATCVNEACVFTARDVDGDSHTALHCAIEGFEVKLGDDCDDKNAAIRPGAWDGPEVPGMYADSCNQRDDNCDGKLDEATHEGNGCGCDPETDVLVDCSLRADGTEITWPAGTPVGACQYGKRTCTGGVWGKCTGAIEPKGADGCDRPGDDADCDGQQNENCPCVNGESRPCRTDVGSCQAGTQTCSGGKWSEECLGAVMPQLSDTCDAKNDNDCDGVPNEGCDCINGTTSTCAQEAAALGVCGTRSVTCKDGRWDVSGCKATQAEVCTDDGLDENCNGRVNEAPACACTNGKRALCLTAQPQLRGACATGNVICVNGQWGRCDTLPASRDLCSILGGDETCNGTRWENCECLDLESQACSVGRCSGGTRYCNSGRWGSCGNATECPPVEDASD